VTTDKARLKPRNWKVTNDCDFVGGVSDGGYGAAVLTLNRDGLEAKKSWFYFDDEIVNLGAGISSDREPVVSSVNQCLATGEVMVAAGDANPGNADGGVREYTDLKWAWHDGVGYVFPSPQRLSLGVQEQTGAWNLVNGRAKPDPVKAPVFSAWINHGDKPRDATYEYVLLPGASREQTAAAAASPKVQILQNTRELQAVRHAGLKRVEVVFHQPGALSFGEGRSIAVDRPCVLMFEELNGRLTIADPTQLLKEITVTLDGKETKLMLPAGAMAGSTLTVVLPQA
jgi:chondroitin AC lyase